MNPRRTVKITLKSSWPSNSNLSQTLKKAKYLKLTQLLLRQSVPTTFHGGIVSKLPTRTWNKAKISLYKWRILWSNLVTHTAWLDAEGFFGLLWSCGSSWTRTRNCSVVLVQRRQWPPRLRSFWSLKLHFDSYIMSYQNTLNSSTTIVVSPYTDTYKNWINSNSKK